MIHACDRGAVIKQHTPTLACCRPELDRSRVDEELTWQGCLPSLPVLGELSRLSVAEEKLKDIKVIEGD